MRLVFNRCDECGKRIPWRKRAFYGNAYMPVVCAACVAASRLKLYSAMALLDEQGRNRREA